MNILCPIDFSDTSLNALEYAVRIGEKHDARLIMLYVFSEEEFNKRLTTEEVKSFGEYSDEASSQLVEIAKKLGKRKKGCQIDWRVEPGKFMPAVSQIINDEGINLLVMGTKGASDVFDAFSGTQTIKIIEEVEIPVLAVPKNANYERIDHAVYASDYAEEDKIAIQSMIELLAPFKPKYTILHMSRKDSTVSQAIYDENRQELDAFLKEPNLEYHRSTYESSVALGIDEFMMREKAELLAVLMEKRNFIERIFHTSVTRKLSYLMDFPLLVYKKA
ncbi:MAG: universal stress protein [Cyclobacteriaceae bacterium]